MVCLSLSGLWPIARIGPISRLVSHLHGTRTLTPLRAVLMALAGVLGSGCALGMGRNWADSTLVPTCRIAGSLAGWALVTPDA